ncbi:hypothetical protein P7K49_033098 [Saguinus oedipus]|uniref:Uncharacterized protein n=1 Tax=Saguinus oedipus TaxID=9490 RepID=A0ABQ9TQY6_SAGOE|nr:hypothetical protein P7K49_033098 [Saguinus oedipus]
MTAASPGRSPTAPGRSASASSTRPLTAAARSSSGPEQPSTASAPASATINGELFGDPGKWGELASPNQVSKRLAHLSSSSDLKRCPWGRVSSSRPDETPMLPR